MGEDHVNAHIEALRKILAATGATAGNQAGLWSVGSGSAPSTPGLQPDHIEQMRVQLEAQQRHMAMLQMGMYHHPGGVGVPGLPSANAWGYAGGYPAPSTVAGVGPPTYASMPPPTQHAACNGHLAARSDGGRQSVQRGGASKKPLTKRGHATSSHALNQRIREQMRDQQARGNLVVKVEKKTRHGNKNNSTTTAAESEEHKVESKGVGAGRRKRTTANGTRDAVHLVGDASTVLEEASSAAHKAAIIMANTPGIVVDGAPVPLPKIDLDVLSREPGSKRKGKNANSPGDAPQVDPSKAAARIAEALMGLRGAPLLQRDLDQE